MENFAGYLTKYNPNITKIFSEKLTDALNILYKISSESNEKIYLVGGIVRDIFIGKSTNDIDMTVEGECKNFSLLVIPKFSVEKHRFSEKFMTCSILTKSGINVDIASCREEIYKYPGALPEVSLSSIKNDFKRRDFTINTMYISFDKEAKLYDPLNALSDIHNRLIKIIHNKSFEDDPTRIFRGIKFAVRYNFDFEENTKKLLMEAVNNNYLSSISNSRLKNEIFILFNEEKLFEILVSLREYNIFKFLDIPKLADKDIEKICDIAEDFNKMKDRCNLLISKERFILSLLINGLSYNEKRKILKKFNISEKDIDNMIFEDNKMDETVSLLFKAQKNSEIYSSLNKISLFKILYLYYVNVENREKIENYIFDLYNKNAIISGSDLIAEGFPKDVSLGKYVKRCFLIQLDMANPNKEKIFTELTKELKTNE